MNLRELKKQYKEDPNNLEKKKKFYEICYEEYKRAEWYTKKLKTIATQNDMNVEEIKKNAVDYAMNYLNISKEEFRYDVYAHNGKSKKYAQRPESKYNVLLQTLLHIPTKNENEIIETIEKTNIGIHHLKSLITTFSIVYYTEQKDEIEKNLKEKINVYAEYNNKKRLHKQEILKQQKLMLQQEIEKKDLDYAKFYVQMFLERHYDSKATFLETTYPKITEQEFERLVKIIEHQDPILFTTYKERMIQIKNLNYLYILNVVTNIFNLIKNGIQESYDTIREFDIIDYYLLTDMPFKKFISVIRDTLTTEEIKFLHGFFNKNQSAQIYDPNVVTLIREEIKTYSIPIKTKDNTISVIKRTLSLEEKNNILEFIKKNRLPLNYKLYATEVNRYFKGYLNFEQEIPILEHSSYIKKLERKKWEDSKF